ncbi:MAG: hypothetical protein ACP5NS_00395 [Candidatus Pacearchaeota archaeon]
MIKSFFKEVQKGKGIEGRIIPNIFASIVISFLILGLLYFAKFRFTEGFLANYGFFLFFGVIIYALLSGVLLQVRNFGIFPCMSGMMIGMTLGMISGFMSGYIIAATNGMFIGSVFGMAFGIIIGVISGGRCCGVMGFLEGTMSGFMGGLMGAMTAFMLFNDNLRLATILVSIVSAVILFALNYMIYIEGKQLEGKNIDGMFFTIVFTFIATTVTTWIMVYGPRSGIFG